MNEPILSRTAIAEPNFHEVRKFRADHWIYESDTGKNILVIEIGLYAWVRRTYRSKQCFNEIVLVINQHKSLVEVFDCDFVSLQCFCSIASRCQARFDDRSESIIDAFARYIIDRERLQGVLVDDHYEIKLDHPNFAMEILRKAGLNLEDIAFALGEGDSVKALEGRRLKNALLK